MVDWVLAAAAAARRPSRSSSSPRRRREDAFDGSTVASRSEPLGTGDAVRTARAALDGSVRRRARPLRRHAARSRASCSRRSSTRTGARARRRPCSRSSPTTPLATAAIVRDADGYAARDRRGGRRERRAARDPRGELVDLRLPRPSSCGRRSSVSSPHNAQGELYLTDAVRHPRRRRRARRGPRRGRPARPRASTRAPSSPQPRRRPARPDQRGAHARGRHDRRPGDDVDRADVELEPDATIHPFTVLRGAHRVGAGAEIGPHAVAIDAEVGDGRDRRAILLPSPRNGARGGREGRHVRGDQELATSGEGTKVPHLSYIGDAEIGRGHEHRRRRDHRQLPAPAGAAEGPDDDRRERQDRHPQWSSMPRSRSATAPGRQAGSFITDDVPPDSLAGFPPRQVTKEGYLRGNRDDD